MKHLEDSFGLIRNLRVARFRLKLQPIEKISLPEYKGSTFRGVLGWRLRKIICVDREQKDCAKCLLASKCLFNYLFSPKLPSNTQFLKNTSNIPSPVLIEPLLTKQQIFEHGDTLEVRLVLIGKGLEYLPYLIYVFTEIGRAGIGKGIHDRRGRKYGGRFKLAEVWDDVGNSLIYNADDQILSDGYKIVGWQEAIARTEEVNGQLSLNFLSPVRIKELSGERNHLVHLSGFGQIISNLYWRMFMLAYFHCNPWNLDDDRFQELSNEASDNRKQLTQIDDVQLIENNTYWKEYDRWSNRQQQKMTFGGFIGEANFSGNLKPYLPLLHLCQFIHLGKQTMFGLGKYEISNSRVKNPTATNMPPNTKKGAAKNSCNPLIILVSREGIEPSTY